MNTKTWKQLQEKLERLGLRAADLDEHFVRSGGHGGQNVNKVSTCVVLTHRPSGLTIRCDSERSQARNRYLARMRLAERWEATARAQKDQEQRAAEKARRQARGPSRAAKKRMVVEKRRRSVVKTHRRRPEWSDA